MNDFGAGPVGVAGTIPIFLQQRGTVGRTPAAWDINVRLGYDLSWRNSLRGRVLLDLLHLGNPREVVQVDEQHYFSLDNGVQSSPNPNYLGPSAYQPPMAARLGIEMRL